MLCLLFALSTSCINRLNDEIKEGSILISFSFEASKAATKVTKKHFRHRRQKRYLCHADRQFPGPAAIHRQPALECSDNSKLISKKEVYYPEGDATLDFISYYPYQEENVSKGSSLLDVTVQADQSKILQLQLIRFHDSTNRKHCQQ